MTSFRIRPRFQVYSPKNPDQLLIEIKERLKRPSLACDAIVIPGHVVLKINKEDQHFWTPQLSLNLEEHEDGTIINGLYGPGPNVWTLFTLSYMAIAFLALFVSIFGFSKLSLGMSAPILWILPILAGIAILLYLISQFGQKLAAEQTFTLHHFLEDLLDKKIPIS